MATSFRYRPDDKGIYRPYVPIRLAHGGRHIDVLALLDSGADACFIPRGLGEYLGYDLNCEGEYSYGVNSRFRVLRASITITIKIDHREYPIPNVPVNICLEDEKDKDLKTFILLGRRGFFDEFEVRFREKDKKVYIKKIDEKQY